MDRRSFVQALSCATLGALAKADEGLPRPLVGMCDWSLGLMANPEAFALAREIGLDGVEVSVGHIADDLWLRRPETQELFLTAAEEHGIAIPSIALGVLNEVPLKSDERAAVWLHDSIDVAHNLGARRMLLAFFGAGELDMADEAGINHVVEILRREAPRAEEADVVLGLENYLSAEDNLRILERVNSDFVRVYYDLRNSADKGYDVPAEIRQLGDRICQVHLKNGGSRLAERENVDFPACAEALGSIGYRGWLVLETASPTDLLEDTRANLEYARETFAACAPEE